MSEHANTYDCNDIQSVIAHIINLLTELQNTFISQLTEEEQQHLFTAVHSASMLVTPPKDPNNIQCKNEKKPDHVHSWFEYTDMNDSESRGVGANFGAFTGNVADFIAFYNKCIITAVKNHYEVMQNMHRDDYTKIQEHLKQFRGQEHSITIRDSN